jgi:hypothetical protein
MANSNREEMIEIFLDKDNPGDARRTTDASQPALNQKPQSAALSGEGGVEQTRRTHMPAAAREPERQSFLMILLRALGAIHT